MIYFFGYSNLKKSHTSFFEYSDHTQGEALFNGFKKTNARSFLQLPTKGDRTYVHNVDNLVDILHPDTLHKLNDCSISHAKKVL